MLPSRSCDYSSEVMLFLLLLKLYRVFLHTPIPMWHIWSIITANKVCLNFFKLFLYVPLIFMWVLVRVSWDIVPVCSCSCVLGYCPIVFLFMYLGILSLFVLVHVSWDIDRLCSCSYIMGH